MKLALICECGGMKEDPNEARCDRCTVFLDPDRLLETNTRRGAHGLPDLCSLDIDAACAFYGSEPQDSLDQIPEMVRISTGTIQSNRLHHAMKDLVIQQDSAIDAIMPYVAMGRAHFSPPNRPIGNFMMLGPTGTGKTHTVEALAKVLHGDEKKVLRINCAEFQLDYDVAKLIGAPPGYIGHRETKPVLSNTTLKEVTSERSHISLVLFDEIEKAAPTLGRLLLGILDKAELRLGDSTLVDFRDSIVFMTSNLGASEMQTLLSNRFGFDAMEHKDDNRRLEQIVSRTLKKSYPPEFVNRIDETLQYLPLTQESIGKILQLELRRLNESLYPNQQGVLTLSPAACDELVRLGYSKEYNARELRRILTRSVRFPLAIYLTDHSTFRKSSFHVDFEEGEFTFYKVNKQMKEAA